LLTINRLEKSDDLNNPNDDDDCQMWCIWKRKHVWKLHEDCSCIRLWRIFWPDSFRCQIISVGWDRFGAGHWPTNMHVAIIYYSNSRQVVPLALYTYRTFICRQTSHPVGMLAVTSLPTILYCSHFSWSYLECHKKFVVNFCTDLTLK